MLASTEQVVLAQSSRHHHHHHHLHHHHRHHHQHHHLFCSNHELFVIATGSAHNKQCATPKLRGRQLGKCALLRIFASNLDVRPMDLESAYRPTSSVCVAIGVSSMAFMACLAPFVVFMAFEAFMAVVADSRSQMLYCRQLEPNVVQASWLAG